MISGSTGSCGASGSSTVGGGVRGGGASGVAVAVGVAAHTGSAMAGLMGRGAHADSAGSASVVVPITGPAPVASRMAAALSGVTGTGLGVSSHTKGGSLDVASQPDVNRGVTEAVGGADAERGGGGDDNGCRAAAGVAQSTAAAPSSMAAAVVTRPAQPSAMGALFGAPPTRTARPAMAVLGAIAGGSGAVPVPVSVSPGSAGVAARVAAVKGAMAMPFALVLAADADSVTPESGGVTGEGDGGGGDGGGEEMGDDEAVAAAPTELAEGQREAVAAFVEGMRRQAEVRGWQRQQPGHR